MHTEQTFDPKKNAREIKELEMDVQRIEMRMGECEYVCRVYEQEWEEKKKAYEGERGRLGEIQGAKDRIGRQMQEIMLGFEEAKEQKVGKFGEYLRQQYRE